MGKSILVIEDDEDIRESLQQVLEMEGYDVVPAGNGREGRAARSQAEPCVILLDLMMPVMNGWEFLQARREQALAANVPVIIVSAAGARATATPAAAHFHKPIDLDRLLDAVHHYCDRGCQGTQQT